MSRKILLITILVPFYCVTYGQLSTREVPVGFKYNLDREQMPVIVMPSVDTAVLNAEDMAEEQLGALPRFGFKHSVDLNLLDTGQWHTLENGDKLCQLVIVCPGALSINLLYDKFWLPSGARFSIYSQNRKHHIGAFTAFNNKGIKDSTGGFATGLVYGDSIVLEYYLPENCTEKAIISISGVVHGYRHILSRYGYEGVPPGTDPYLGFNHSGKCHFNINCSEGDNWQKEKNAVALIVVNGERWASGFLINNTNNNHYPYFLTANHCLFATGSDGENGDAVDNPNLDHWTFYWNYELPPNPDDCNYDNFYPIEPLAFCTSGAKVVANNGFFVSDFALLELKEDPMSLCPSYTPYYLGWDRTGNPGTGGVGIHHPCGDVKKISTYLTTPTSFVSTVTSWWIVVWNSGITEGGSSGSPLINSDHRVIGQLYQGNSSCNYPKAENMYGKFHISWTGNNATERERRLSDWLDPCNTSVDILDGISSIILPEIITQNTIWNTSKSINGTITVEANATLTISQGVVVHCTANTQIIVEQGGKLIIDGGTLTSACDGELWEGIVVFGNPGYPQTPANQGVVELKNGATIENAVYGIRAGWNLGGNYPTGVYPGGGIIYAEDAHFINNKQAVYFAHYSDYSNGILQNNKSYFKNCTFEINQPLNAMGYQETMVELQGVHGVKFTNCQFLNNIPPTPFLSVAPIGIYANSSNIIIGESSATSMSGSGCEFSRLYYAMWLQNSNEISIYASNFNNNHIGIMAVGSNRLTVENNQFDILSQNYSFTAGIYLMGYSLYRIENNNFAELGLQPLGSGKGTGIITYNTGVLNNFIKSNSFSGLCTACLAIGENSGGNNNECSQGLVYQCNDFFNNNIDISVEEDSRIRFIQSGTSSIWATGNTFSAASSWHIMNNGDAFQYHWYSFLSSHEPFKWQGTVDLKPKEEVHCTSFGYAGYNYYTTVPEEYLVSLNSSYMIAKELYDGKKDDNDDDIVVIDWNSPTVQAIVEQLEMTVTGNDFIITIGGNAPVTDLEKQIVLYYELTYLKQYMDNICYTALEVLANDTAGLDMAQYRTWIGRFNTIESEYLLIETYISVGEFEEAEEILEAMPTKFPELDLESYENYLDYFAAAQEIYSLDLEEGEDFPSHLIAELVRLSSNDDFVAIKAYSLGEMLFENWREEYPREFTVHPACVCSYDNSSSVMQNGSGYNNTSEIKGQDNQTAKTADDPLNTPQSAEKKGEITVKPNPTNGQLQITSCGLEVLSVEVYDVVGKQYSVGAKHVLPNESTITMDISRLANGMYFLKIQTDNGTVMKKIVKQ